jgi:hypothetical protein
MSKLEIAKMLIISTAHVTENTAKKFDGMFSLPSSGVPYKDVGWLFAVDQESIANDISHDLWECLDFARRQGCQYLLMDRDADKIDELPQFDW